MISINGVPFEKVPGCDYKYDYEGIARRIRENYVDPVSGVKWGEKDPGTGMPYEFTIYRKIIKSDLWFVVYFILKPWGDETGRLRTNSPFVVNACREVEGGPKDLTLDVWAREHYKSSIITKAETIQFAVCNPESSTGIFSHTRPAAKKFMDSIRAVFQSSGLLRDCFRDVIWDDCERDAPLWSEEGLILKRTSTRSEPTVSAWGLVEGMPTGAHFERLVFDDVVTDDIKNSVDQMEKVKEKFDAAQHLGKEGGHQRVVGTFYHHNGPLVYIKGKKTLDGSRPQYLLRLKPGTHDGTATGKPVMVSQERLDFLKGTIGFDCQILCNPTPKHAQRLNPDFLNKIDPAFIPRSLFRVMIVDQAGDLASNKSKTGGDSWAMGIFGVEPAKDAAGQHRVFLEDLWVTPSSSSEAIDQAIRMYLRAGIVHKLGVEKVGISTTHQHIADALKAHGRHVEFGDSIWDVGVLLRPAGREKKKFIEDALAWPLNNGKLFYSTSIPYAFIERLKLEMTNHPVWHDDALNIWAYLYDVTANVPIENFVTTQRPRSVTEVMDSMPQASWR